MMWGSTPVQSPTVMVSRAAGWSVDALVAGMGWLVVEAATEEVLVDGGRVVEVDPVARWAPPLQPAMRTAHTATGRSARLPVKSRDRCRRVVVPLSQVSPHGGRTAPRPGTAEGGDVLLRGARYAAAPGTSAVTVSTARRVWGASTSMCGSQSSQ